MQRHRIIGTFAIGAMALSACGGDDDLEGAVRDALEQARDASDDAAEGSDGGTSQDSAVGRDPGDGDGGSTNARVQPPVFLLTGPVSDPAGFVVDLPPCADPDTTTGPDFYRWARPAEWTPRGAGSAGGGSVMGSSGTRTYEHPSGGELEIEISDENYGMGDDVVTMMGVPWETWDYDIESFGSDGERTHRATYQLLDPVEIDRASVDLWYLDAGQSDLITASEYKARIVYAEMPSGGADLAQRRPASTEVTFSWNPERTTLTEDEVRAILPTFRTEPCTEDDVRSMLELIFGVEWDE